MDTASTRKPDIKKKLVVVGDGAYVLLDSELAALLTIEKVAVGKPVCSSSTPKTGFLRYFTKLNLCALFSYIYIYIDLRLTCRLFLKTM